MRSSILFFVLLAGVPATAQQQFVANPHMPPLLRSQMPAVLPPDIRLLAEATTQVNDSNITWLHDSVTYIYSARQPLSNEGYWRYDIANAIDKNSTGGTQQSRYIQTFNTTGELAGFELQVLNNQNAWVTDYSEAHHYQNGKRIVRDWVYKSMNFNHKDSFVYNTNGQIIEEATSTQSKSGGKWSGQFWAYSQYGPDGITDRMSYQFTPANPVLTVSEHYTYTNGKITALLKKRNTGTSVVNEELQALSYAANGLVDKYWIFNWNNSQQTWDTTATYIPEYDNNNRDTLWMIRNHNTNTWTKTRHVYDANGLIVKASRQWLDPSTSIWQQGFERHFYYGMHNLNINDKKDKTKEVLLYPVPASKYLNIDISMPVKQELQLAIFHIDGRIVRIWNQPAISTDYKEQIDLSSIPPGNYSLQVNSADGKIVKQFTITR